jgi:imidazolonepropionase
LPTKQSDAAPDRWVLIRRVRQLVTLQGPSGARRGSAMNDIGVVTGGAVLILNGAVFEAGSARRIESLQQARAAREIDAGGRLVMPAFVDPDAVLVSQPPARSEVARSDGSRTDGDIALAVLSRKRLEIVASAAATALATSGVLAVGAHTRNATTLRETTKTLLIHRELQKKPLRIRSIFSPPVTADFVEITAQWLPAVLKRKLASILELTLSASSGCRELATACASAGFTLRFRSSQPLDDAGCELALEAGAVAIVAPPPANTDYAQHAAALGCVHVLVARDALDCGRDFAVPARALLEAGAAVALASGYGARGYATCNPQHLLHLATARFGFSPEAAICATTWNAACSLRMSHVTGSLQPGKTADLVIMDVPDYRELSRRAGHNDAQLVMREGRVIYRRAGLISD